LAAEIFNNILKKEPNNIEVTIDLAYLYFNKLQKKQESIDLLLECLKVTTEERDKIKLQTKINKMMDQTGDQYEKELFDDLEDRNPNNMDNINFLDDSRDGS